MPSTVLTRRPAQARPSTRQERTGVPSSSTVHVPHSPSSQPCLVPVSPASSRSTSSRVLCGAKATSTGSPFSSSAIFALASGIVPKRNLDNRVVGRQLSASKERQAYYDGHKRSSPAPGISVRQSAGPPVGPGLPRPGSPHSQDRSLDRRAQRPGRRHQGTRRARLGGRRRVAAEAHDRHPEAP